MNSEFYTETAWDIEIDKHQNAKHRLVVKLFHLAKRIPAIHQNISMTLPEGRVFRNFHTKVDGNPLEPGHGYMTSRHLYVLELENLDPSALARKPCIDVEISFEQAQAIRKVASADILELDFESRFHSSAIELVIHLPEVEATWKKYFLRFLAFIRKKKGMYEIQPIGILPQIDEGEKRISYQLRGEVMPNFGIIYRSIGRVGILSLVMGIIIGILVQIIGSLLYRVLIGG